MLPVPGDNVFPRENSIVLRVFAAFGFTYVRSAGYCEYIFALFPDTTVLAVFRVIILWNTACVLQVFGVLH